VRHSTGVRFFAVILEEGGKFVFAEPHDEVRGRFPLCRVETQIERTVGAKAEPAGVVGQLVGRQTQVEQNPIDRGNCVFRQDPGEFGITGLMEVARKARELKGRNVQHQGIAVKTD
jgi:hypothetical protein